MVNDIAWKMDEFQLQLYGKAIECKPPIKDAIWSITIRT